MTVPGTMNEELAPGTLNSILVAGNGVFAHNTYGPRMRPADGRVVSDFIVQALRGEPLTIYGDGSQTRSFCYVEDEVDGIWRLFNSGRVEPTNIGNPNEFTIRQLADVVLGWEPKVQLVEGVRRTIPYFRELVEKDGAKARTL